MKKIVLFDMDGTLTEPRKYFDYNLLTPLRELTIFAEIGIVTGSDFSYVQEQMKHILSSSAIRYRMHILPCNGTKHYIPPIYSDEDHHLKHERKMKNILTDSEYNNIIKNNWLNFLSKYAPIV